MAKQNPATIVGAINQGGRTYRAGDEEAFSKVLNPASMERLTARATSGASGISGDWDFAPTPDPAPEPSPEPAPAPPAPESQPVKPKAPRPRRSRTPSKRGK